MVNSATAQFSCYVKQDAKTHVRLSRLYRNACTAARVLD